MDEAISSLEDLCFEKLQIYFLTYPERKINLLKPSIKMFHQRNYAQQFQIQAVFLSVRLSI